jgi:hypothetical protein
LKPVASCNGAYARKLILGGPMRVVIGASLAAAAGLTAAGVLGVASAEGPTATTAPQRTVTVQGVATESIDQHASVAAANAAYHQGLADAVADGQSKAQLLAAKVGASLGPAQTVLENGGYISCAGDGESGGTAYEGAQPDFGSQGISVASAPGAARPLGVSRRPGVKRHRVRRVPAAKKASGGTCTLSAQVSLVYPLG